VWFRGLILVLLLISVAPSASAAVDREPAGPTVGGILSALWQDLVEMITMQDSGPGMDPNGSGS